MSPTRRGGRSPYPDRTNAAPSIGAGRAIRNRGGSPSALPRGTARPAPALGSCRSAGYSRRSPPRRHHPCPAERTAALRSALEARGGSGTGWRFRAQSRPGHERRGDVVEPRLPALDEAGGSRGDYPDDSSRSVGGFIVGPRGGRLTCWVRARSSAIALANRSRNLSSADGPPRPDGGPPRPLPDPPRSGNKKAPHGQPCGAGQSVA